MAETIADWTPAQLESYIKTHLLNSLAGNIKRDLSGKITIPVTYADGQVLTFNSSKNAWLANTPTGGGGSGYNLVQDEGVPLTARTTMNFVGTGVTATDSGVVTTVTIPTPAAYATVQDEGVGLTQRSTINFIGANVTAVDNGGSSRTDVTVATQQAYATVQDEGTPLTQRTTMNFTGAGVTATDSGGITVVTIPGGGAGSLTVTEVEIDFGSGVGVFDKTFTIVDATVGAASKILVVQSGNAATGRGDGDSLWDSIDYAAKPAVGSFTLFAQANPGPISGKRKIFYTVA